MDLMSAPQVPEVELPPRLTVEVVLLPLHHQVLELMLLNLHQALVEVLPPVLRCIC
jgi:hypothetical protein